MKEIKAYVHRSRVADVLEAVKATNAWAGQHNLTAVGMAGKY